MSSSPPLPAYTTPSYAATGGTPHSAAASPEPEGEGAANPAGAAGRQQPPAGKPILKELGGLAAWSVTSAKPGSGVELLRDGSTDTYWQSDGIQPHLVNMQFNRRVAVQEVHLYVDYKSDESYTPSRLSIRAGSAHHDLKDICIVELREPTGWVKVPLAQPSPGGEQRPAAVQAFFFQVAVLANHQNGRDTHIRQILLYGPSGAAQASSSCGAAVAGQHLQTLESSVFATLR